MMLPPFNYSKTFFHQVQSAGILFSEQSILKLKCFIEPDRSSDQSIALANFEWWKLTFIRNCNEEFYKQLGPAVDVLQVEYTETMLNCLLVAELFSWSCYGDILRLNSSSFIRWNGNAIVATRKLSMLI